MNWCEKEGIGSISDLDEKIVSEEDFRELWIERYQRMHERVDEEIKYIHIGEENDDVKKSDIWSQCSGLCLTGLG